MSAYLEDDDRDGYKFPVETYGCALKIWAKEQSARHLDEVDGEELALSFTEA